MRNSLPPAGPRNYEKAIVNLDLSLGPGTHWVAYKKFGKNVYYFDSYGNLKPPPELIEYFKNCKIYFNHKRFL